jgi:acyl-coenzyme A thioesterase PaaI-like protein
MNAERIAQLLRMFNEVAPIARYLGMTLSFTGEGRAVVDLPYNPNLDHALDGVRWPPDQAGQAPGHRRNAPL